jgi:hypothetical protein
MMPKHIQNSQRKLKAQFEKLPNKYAISTSKMQNTLNSQNLSQAHFLKRLSQADEPRMNKKSADFYVTVQKVVLSKSFGSHKIL